ncbi:hypothetical protein DDF62_25045, partial [Caulobacter radicis]|uniref:hypothetical protein n=1 Tax=Caulobacter radicis TaxID=2172650 RepID=UPI000D57ED98
RLKTLLAAPVIVDLRNVYKPHEMVRHGFTYASVGRGAAAEGGEGAGLKADERQMDAVPN